eukprot:CAMPEP_0174240368 /NCGR_PEP_ID=MMETSP0417-20130205/18519_1 /TAXON_ID=242541 /ORGANISM="Mayorella sp, Strain BSH-02190019" /LENGTH=994 /DNA_ID=CAMNT_0015319451 /DNA_START=447 /DNA_END=3431 /DNA_ORIENTATION=-
MARWGHSLTLISESTALLFGGCTTIKAVPAGRNFLDDQFILSRSTLKYLAPKVTGSPPSARCQHAACSIGPNRALVFGGFNGMSHFNDLYLVSMVGDDTLSWEKISAKGELPMPRSGHTMSFVNNKVIVFGGQTGSGFLNDVRVLNLDSWQWSDPYKGEIPANVPSVRAEHSATIVGGLVFIFGGVQKNGSAMRDMYSLNSDTFAWECANAPGSMVTPQPRYGHTATQLNSSIIVLGGCGGVEATEKFVSQVAVFDTVNRNWNLPHLDMQGKLVEETVLGWHAAVQLTNTKILVFGGMRLEFYKHRRVFKSRTLVSNELLVLYHLNKLNLQDPTKPSLETSQGSRRRSPSIPAAASNTLRIKPRGLLGRKKKKDSKQQKGGVIGTPYNVVQTAHVDAEFNWTSTDNDVFTMQEELGKGAYATVYKGVHNASGFLLAIKEIENIDADEELKKEIDILKACKHQNIVCYYGTYNKDKNLWILMDYCGVGSVRDLIDTLQKPLNEEQIAYICLHSLKGLHYLHSRDIIHRDVKAGNILLTDEGDIKIADFGVSEQLSSAVAKADDLCGTPLWMAPEVILEDEYDVRCDIWSLGITAIEMVQGYPPHARENPVRMMRQIPKIDPPTAEDPSKYVAEFNEFVAHCLVKDPSQRPTAVDLLKSDPFLLAVMAKNSDMLTEDMATCQKIKAEKLAEKLAADAANASDNSDSEFMPSGAAGTFVLGSGDDDDDDDSIPAYGTMVMNGDDNDDGIYGTMVMHSGEGDGDDEQDTGSAYGTLVMHGGDEAAAEEDDGSSHPFGLSAAVMGTFVMRGDDDEGPSWQDTMVVRPDPAPAAAGHSGISAGGSLDLEALRPMLRQLVREVLDEVLPAKLAAMRTEIVEELRGAAGAGGGGGGGGGSSLTATPSRSTSVRRPPMSIPSTAPPVHTSMTLNTPPPLVPRSSPSQVAPPAASSRGGAGGASGGARGGRGGRGGRPIRPMSALGTVSPGGAPPSLPPLPPPE